MFKLKSKVKMHVTFSNNFYLNTSKLFTFLLFLITRKIWRVKNKGKDMLTLTLVVHLALVSETSTCQ